MTKKRNKLGQFEGGSYQGSGFKKGHKPWNKGKKGLHLSPETQFKKGIPPWNKGKKGLQVAWNKGIKGTHFSIETEFKKGQNKGIKNGKWRGNRVGYFGLHTWIQRTLGKAASCKNVPQYLPFKCSEKSKKFDWANRSRKYKRSLNDWVELCHSCHLKADRRGITL